MSENNFDAADRALYRRWTREILRYSDLDPVGHVNNNAYGLFVENARTMLFNHVDDLMREANVTLPDFDWVIRRLEFDYLSELRYPGEVEVGLAITRMGNSSMIMRHGVFQGDTLSCSTMGVSVCFDLDARGSMPIPEAIRKVFWDAAGVG
jgi:acyl-CoA thioester hydrolase